MKTKVIAVTSKLKPETKEARSRHIERSTHAHTVCVLLNVFAFLAFFSLVLITMAYHQLSPSLAFFLAVPYFIGLMYSN